MVGDFFKLLQFLLQSTVLPTNVMVNMALTLFFCHLSPKDAGEVKCSKVPPELEKISLTTLRIHT